MADSEKHTVTLQTEEAEYVDSLVASGAYSSPSEVVRAGLHALQERDASVESWLRDEVIPVYDAMQRDPERAVSGDEVLAAIEERHTERMKNRKRGA